MDTYSTKVLREGLGFGESPRWHGGRLWFSDFYRKAVYSVRADGTDERLEHHVEAQPSGLGWLGNGDLLCVSMTDHRVLRLAGAATETWSDISEYCGFWANDMVVAPSGHAYVGNFGFDLDTLLAEQGPEGLLATPPPTTHLVVLDPSGQVIQAVPDMAFPNGSVITPDRRTLIVGETMGFRLTAFTINDDGTLADRRLWAQLDFVATDGACLDAEGQMWVANALTNECLRVREGGEITARVTTNQRAFACMLGGDDRRTLYVMTAPTSDRFQIAGQTLGAIEAAEVAVPGAGWP
ncbi:MAG TPA: SMP-30/gluconolactonase/LRE family protein [Acidimicrobiales bacterium]|nr:SMP-30/gluconolactonase/LRE family protein [Acidimicrobiales bacterium]